MTQASEIDILTRALKRERLARKSAEKILEAKSEELYYLNQELEASHQKLSVLYSKTSSQLQGVFENIVDAYVIIDLFGNVLKMNDAAVKLLGVKDAEAKVNFMNIIDSNEITRAEETFKTFLKKGSITNFTVKIRDLNKKSKYIHVNGSVISESGKPVAAQGIIRDITSERKYQKKIEEERQKFSSIIANMHLGLLEVDTRGRVLMANQSFLDMCGYTSKELIGKVARDVLLTSSDERLDTKTSGGYESITADSFEVEVKTKKGAQKNWLISRGPNYDFNDNITGAIGVYLDITEQKQLQAQKEELLRELERSNDELKEYAHIVSHDLKSPLRSINALVSWLKEDNANQLDANSLENFALIESTLEKMERLITDVLHFSSIGAASSKNENVDINSLLTDIQELLYIPNHIKVNIRQSMPVIKGDRTKLQQLFQNLLSNAIKFSDKPEGLIEVSVKDQKSCYEFTISDNGMGIDKKYHDKIFKVFHSLKKQKDSSGIGLSIVKKVVDLHGGDIWLDSEVGKGTSFHFTLTK